MNTREGGVNAPLGARIEQNVAIQSLKTGVQI